MADLEQNAHPVFRHNCPSCIYLGLHYIGLDEDYDLYFCPRALTGPTVIARFGNDGQEYLSGLAIADNVPALHEAKRRAQLRGLL